MRFLINALAIKVVIIILLVLALATGLIIAYVLFMENTTYEKESLKKATLIEEMMYEDLLSVMRLGGNREDVANMIKRLNKIEAIKDIKVIRSPIIDEQYKIPSEARLSGRSDGEEIALLLGQQIKMIEKVNGSRAVKVIRPTFADLSCVKCHPAKTGDALGAISFKISLKELDEEVRQRSKALISFFIIDMLIIALCLLVVLRGMVIVPIERLSSTMDRIAKGGNLDEKVDVGSKDEIGNLAGAFNAMVSELQESRKRLLDWNRGMEDGIRERTKRLSVFISINKTLTSASKPREMIEFALDKLMKVLPRMSSSKVSLFSTDLNNVGDFAASGILCDTAESGYNVSVFPRDLADSLLKLHKPYLAPDISIVPALGEYLFKLTKGEKIKSAYFFPIILRDIPRGFLSIFVVEHLVLMPDEVEMFQSIAGAIGLALEVK